MVAHRCAILHVSSHDAKKSKTEKVANMNTEKTLLTIQDVTKILKISRRTVYYWIESGVLNPIRIGSVYRFDPDSIDALSSQGKETPAEKASILAIDDDFLVRESLKVILEREGIGVTLASSGEEALRFIAEKEFDLIVTDVRMPGMNGMETLKAIRAEYAKAGKNPVPEIVMTAYEDVNAQNEAAKMGVKEFIYKPFELNHFLNILRQNIPNHGR